MSQTPTNPDAFPHVMGLAQQGMSLRDYFAAKAMQGNIAHAGLSSCNDAMIAHWAYDLADAMLDARSRVPLPAPPVDAKAGR
jgi:aminoglycoside/choline kinase family phosphotransferase